MSALKVSRQLLILSIALTGIRLALAAVFPVTQDESYYFYWARFLDWGYFDHPPLVAWLSSLVNIYPGQALAARTGTLVLSVLALPLLWSLFGNFGLQDFQKRFLALLLASGNIAAILLGFITTPDIPMIFCWIAALHEASSALDGRPHRWLSAGLVTGLGILGKYTMLLIGPVFLIALLCEPKQLKRFWPYAGGLVCVLTLLPHLLWLSQHEWITLRFQFGRGLKSEYGVAMTTGSSLPLAQTAKIDSPAQGLAEFFVLKDDEKPKPPRPEPSPWVKAFESVGDYLGGQLSLWGAFLVPLLWAAFRQRSSPKQSLDAPRAVKGLMWASCLVPLILFGLLSPKQHVEANWPAMYLIGAAPLLTQILSLNLASMLTAFIVNVLLCLLLTVHCYWPLQSKRAHNDRILKETHGYAALAHWLTQDNSVVFVDTYQNLSQLAFHQSQLPVQQWPGIARTSELLRRPEMNPLAWTDLQGTGRFRLLTDLFVPPDIPGAKIEGLTEILDCTQGSLGVTESRPGSLYTRPCDNRIHRWSLATYRILPPQRGAGKP